MANIQAIELETPIRAVTPAPTGRIWAGARQVLSFLLILLVLVGLWEGYKLLGAATNNTVPFTSLRLPVRSDDKSMPNLWDMLAALLRPAQRGNADTLLIV